MKNFKKYLIAIITLVAFASCDKDIIELTERDRLPTAIAVANIDGLEASMLDVYVQARNVHESNEISLYKQCGTDIVRSGTNMIDVSAGGMRGMMEYTSGMYAGSSQMESIFNGLYLSIDKCNVVISYGNNFESDIQEEINRKNRIIGEAYALRAYLYLELGQRWDNVVLYTELSDEINYDAVLSPKEEVFAQVIADCNAAIPLLKARGETLGVGAPSIGLAYHLLSKAQMELGNWAEAAQAAEDVISKGGYTLQPLDYIFGLKGGKQGEESNEELIFSWVFDPGIQNRPQRTVQMFVPLYDRMVGVLRSLEQGARPWSRLSPSDYYWTLFDQEDGRLEAWHKTHWIFDDSDNLPDGVTLGDAVTREHLLDWASNDNEERYLDPTTTKTWEDGTYGRLPSEAEGFRNVIVYRLSEAYIIGAEAHWRAGNEGRALELINTIRERAYGNSNHNFSSLDQDTILDEHARELGHEGHRWAMLKRLGLLVERVRLHNPSGSGDISDIHVRWPIPQTYVDLTKVTQNEGY